jgi:hypothetical protein
MSTSMRIVVSGSHSTGKTTLVADLVARLPGFRAVEEPYHAMEAEGHAFAATPGIDDFEALIERAAASLTEDPHRSTIFDRGPIDYLAYLAVVSHDAASVMGEWLPRLHAALQSIDLFVFVPIEEPDRMAGSTIEARGLRRQTDAMLRALLIDDAWSLNPPVLQVTGSPPDRANQVAAWLGSRVIDGERKRSSASRTT